eukprot:Nk52_evm73s223 gene=Nk52_evmTU73s223
MSDEEYKGLMESKGNSRGGRAEVAREKRRRKGNNGSGVDAVEENEVQGEEVDEELDVDDWKLNVRAQYHYDLMLYQKGFGALKEYVALKNLRLKQLNLAEQYSLYRLRCKVWGGWRKYVTERVEKQVRYAFCDRHNRWRMKKRMFALWKRKIEQRLRLKGMDLVASTIQKQATQKRFFKTWEEMREEKQVVQSAMNGAKRFYSSKILSKTFAGWSTFSEMCKDDEELAEAFSRRSKIASSFRIWENVLYLKQNEKLRPLLEKAKSFKTSKMQMKTFDAWRVYLKERRSKNAKKKLAKENFDRQLLEKGMGGLKKALAKREKKTLLLELQKAFIRRNYCRKYYNLWKTEYNKVNELEQALNQASDFWEFKLCQSVLREWRAFAVESYNDRFQSSQAEVHRNRRLVQKCMGAWKACTEESLHEEELWHMAVQFHRRNFLKRIYAVFAGQIWEDISENEKEVKARAHFRKRKLGNVFARMIFFTEFSKKKRTDNAKAALFWKLRLLKCFFAKYQNQFEASRNSQKALEKASHHETKIVSTKFWRIWRAYVYWKAAKKQRDLEVVGEFIEKLRLQRLRKAWKGFSTTVVSDIIFRKRMEAAAAYHKTVLIVRCFNGWRQYNHRQFHRKLLFTKADELYSYFLTRRMFAVYKREYIEKLIDKVRNRKALFHWARTVKHKVFVEGFVTHLQNARLKKKRYVDALGARRERVLKNGIASWVKIALSSRQMQSEQAIKAQVIKSYQNYALAEKYAKIWRSKTIANREKRNKSKGQGPLTTGLGESYRTTKGQEVANDLRDFGIRPLPSNYVPEGSSFLDPNVGLPRPKRTQPRKPTFLSHFLLHGKGNVLDTKSDINAIKINIVSDESSKENIAESMNVCGKEPPGTIKFDSLQEGHTEHTPSKVTEEEVAVMQAQLQHYQQLKFKKARIVEERKTAFGMLREAEAKQDLISHKSSSLKLQELNSAIEHVDYLLQKDKAKVQEVARRLSELLP